MNETKENNNKELSLKDRLDKLDTKLDDLAINKEVTKKFKKKSNKIPYKVKSKLKKGILKNKVLVIYLKMNQNIQYLVGEFKLGQLFIGDEEIKTAEDNIIWQLNGKTPCAIVMEWDLNPITRESLMKESVKNKTLAAPQKIIIRQIMAANTLSQDKKKMDSKTIIILFVVGAAAMWIMFGGGN